MASQHWHRKRCKVCGKPAPDGGPVSAQGFCREHGLERMTANLDQLEAGRGPFAAWWAFRLANAVWGGLVDDAPPRP